MPYDWFVQARYGKRKIMKCPFRIRQIRNEYNGLLVEDFEECLGFSCPAYQPIFIRNDDLKNKSKHELETITFTQRGDTREKIDNCEESLDCLRLHPR